MKIHRNKAWRVAKRKAKNSHCEQFGYVNPKREKCWKLLNFRSNKLCRARQLGMEYPPRTLRQLLDDELPLEEYGMKNLLFICSRNQWRSPTAEQVWKSHSNLNVRSAGTSPRAKRTVSVKDIQWADIIFVMEQKHKNRLKAGFTRLLTHKEIYVLDIPDEYQYMDTELIEILQQSVGSYLGIAP